LKSAAPLQSDELIEKISGMKTYDPVFFLCLARGLGFRLNGESTRKEKFEGAFAFRSLFGISPETACTMYQLGNLNKKKITPKHFLWGLILLQSYETETNLAAVFATTRKTFRKRAFAAIRAVASALPLVVSNMLVMIIF
jgi:hypothetical protein